MFDQFAIGDVSLTQDAGDLVVRWTSTAPAGSAYQVYVGGRLAWSGFALSCVVPAPAPGGNTRIDVGTVDAGELRSDLSSTLPAAPGSRAFLEWEGGRFQADDIESFAVFRSSVAGGAVSYASAVDGVPAYPGGILTDGYGMGGYGAGGYGRAGSLYRWTSPPLGPGTWTFAVAAVDRAGNRVASPRTVAVTIAGPPRPPAANAAGLRLTASYNPATGRATLSWLASPG